LVPLNHDPTSNYFTLGQTLVDANLGWCMTFPFNMLSSCPVLSVPSGFAEANFPTGAQMVGRSFDDITQFRAGAALEAMQSGAAARPNV